MQDFHISCEQPIWNEDALKGWKKRLRCQPGKWKVPGSIPGQHLNLVRDQEGWVEADTELADQVVHLSRTGPGWGSRPGKKAILGHALYNYLSRLAIPPAKVPKIHKISLKVLWYIIVLNNSTDQCSIKNLRFSSSVSRPLFLLGEFGTELGVNWTYKFLDF